MISYRGKTYKTDITFNLSDQREEMRKGKGTFWIRIPNGALGITIAHLCLSVVSLSVCYFINIALHSIIKGFQKSKRRA